MGDMACLEQVVTGAKGEYGKKNVGKKERLLITPDILLEMKEVWNKQPNFGFLRSGEITVTSENTNDKSVHLNMADVAVDSTTSLSLVRVTIKELKTD